MRSGAGFTLLGRTWRQGSAYPSEPDRPHPSSSRSTTASVGFLAANAGEARSWHSKRGSSLTAPLLAEAHAPRFERAAHGLEPASSE